MVFNFIHVDARRPFKSPRIFAAELNVHVLFADTLALKSRAEVNGNVDFGYLDFDAAGFEAPAGDFLIILFNHQRLEPGGVGLADGFEILVGDDGESHGNGRRSGSRGDRPDVAQNQTKCRHPLAAVIERFLPLSGFYAAKRERCADGKVERIDGGTDIAAQGNDIGLQPCLDIFFLQLIDHALIGLVADDEAEDIAALEIADDVLGNRGVGCFAGDDRHSRHSAVHQQETQGS